MLTSAYRQALRLVGNPAVAEDLAAEALTRTYVHWARVGKMEHRNAWLLRVVTNLAIDAMARRREDLIRDQQSAPPEEAAILRVTLAAALRDLSSRQRDAVVLRYLADMSEVDVADALGVTPGTVKTHLSRAVANLRARLGPTFPSQFEVNS